MYGCMVQRPLWWYVKWRMELNLNNNQKTRFRNLRSENHKQITTDNQLPLGSNLRGLSLVELRIVPLFLSGAVEWESGRTLEKITQLTRAE